MTLRAAILAYIDRAAHPTFAGLCEDRAVREACKSRPKATLDQISEVNRELQRLKREGVVEEGAGGEWRRCQTARSTE